MERGSVKFNSSEFNMLNIEDLRRDYQSHSLDLEDLHADPFVQFQTWFEEAQRAQILEPNAMVLATASVKAKPSSRSMLLKGLDNKGLLFFTNYESRKARELLENPFASATFLWKELERQVIVEGSVEKISETDSQAYFHSRPRGSQVSAWASHQGKPVTSREMLDQEYARLEAQFANTTIPLPPFWGGFRLVPERFEFWQGRKNRLHDRFHYLFKGQRWHIERLFP